MDPPLKTQCLTESQRLLNQVCAGRSWFLEIVPVQMSVCVFVCVCVSAPEAINN